MGKAVSPQTLKGFRDFLPAKMAVRNEVIRRLRGVFESFGFDELQTPALEYEEVLLGKYGKEAEKLMYLFKDPGGRGVGLRYDLTVPLARVAASYADLQMPFKRYQIQPAWRAENTQKGRYREFWQCDVDTVGSSSPLADAEIMAVTCEALSNLGFKSFRLRVNSRVVLYKAMEKAGLTKDKWTTTIQSIDKLDKKSKEEVEGELKERGLGLEEARSVFAEVEAAQPDEFLKEAMRWARKLGAGEKVVFDSTLSRGLDYYTGPIYESVVDEPKIGSITGGGRYDKLLATIGGPDLPACGTTIGLDRVVDVIEELDLWPDIKPTKTVVLVAIFSKKMAEDAAEIVCELRQRGINAELYADEKVKLEKQFKYADKKGVDFVVVLGPEEKSEGKVTVKNLRKREQVVVKREELVKLLAS